MKKTILLLGIVAALALAAADRIHENTLQQGIDLLETKGDLPAAITAFEEVSKSPDRNLAARALLYLGSCYQKLGEDKAQSAYERVVREFGDQKDAAPEARMRLASLRHASTSYAGIVTRQVWSGPKVNLLGTVSPDGRYLSYTDWSTGNLGLRDLATGKDHNLTNKGTWLDSFEFAEESAISRDGKQVAYNWFNEKDNRYDLRLLGLNGNGPATPRVLYTNEDVEWPYPFDWSPDGKWVAVQVQRKDRTKQIGLVNTGDGALRVLKSVDWRGTTKMLFSPDGRYVAFDLPQSEQSEDRDVFVLAADGSREIPAVVHPANDVAMGWAPDGTHLLFASDRSGSMGLWALSFADGRPQGTPVLIKADIGRPMAMGLTRSGALYYGVALGGRDVYIASFDIGSGEVLSPPVRPIQQFVLMNLSPDWSPDGKYLAYFSNREPVLNRSNVLAIRSMEAGQVRELWPNLNYFNGPRWAPDGRSLTVIGTDQKGRRGIYRIDAQSGETSAIVLDQVGRRLGFPQWSPDGKRLFYHVNDNARKDEVNVERDLASGKEPELMRGNDLSGVVPAPNGRQLAYTTLDRAHKQSMLMILPAEGGQPRELFRLQEPQSFGFGTTEWTPDSRSIVIRKDLSATDDTLSEFWLVPLDGSQPRKLNLNVPHVFDLRFHPKSNQVAFTAGETKWEVWVMENFLPTLSAAR